MIDEYGSLRHVQLKFEKLPPLFCAYCRRVGHKQISCPFRRNDLANQLSSASEDDPDVTDNRQIGAGFLNLTTNLAPSESDNLNHGVNIVISTRQQMTWT